MNEPSQGDWAILYKAAIKFKQISLWKWMSNEDFFAVENPCNGELGYCSILGEGQQEYGLDIILGDHWQSESLEVATYKEVISHFKLLP